MKTTHRLTIVTLLATLLTPSLAPGGETLEAIFKAYDRWERQEYPELAMSRGDYSNAGRITDQSIRAIERRHQEILSFQERLEAIDESRLPEEDRISYELFDLKLRRQIDEHGFRTFLAPLGILSGPLQDIPQMAEGVRFVLVTDFDHYMDRLEQVPQAIDAYIARMRLGVQEGRTPPRVTLDGVEEQFEALLGEHGLDALAVPLKRLPPRISATREWELRERFKTVSLPAVREALKRFADFVISDYLPGCRETLAASDWPNGEAFYRHRLRMMTTTELTARQIHEIGLSEVSRIRADMMRVIRSTDYMTSHPEAKSLSDDELFANFIDYLRTDPRFYYDTPEELLTGYRDICKRIDAWMPKLFQTLPRLPYGVRAVPAYAAPHTTTAYYSGGDIRNAEPGYFYANTYDLKQRPKYEMIALALHEAVPGHHHQSAIAQELEGVPEFRRNVWFTAFGEGWALYSERLGIEMGLYEDPYDDFGRLTYEMWRACRLVVDPGIHAFKWPRERAVQFMLANSALSELNVRTEVDRYISWPGQACGYKIGELKIRELREKGERILGEAFDVREFHDVVLGAGSIPLTVLERRVNNWIRVKQLAGRSYD